MGLFTRKPSIAPEEVSALRSELAEVRARLDESEHHKANLEDRLSSLTATTMVLSSTAQSDTAEMVEKIVMLEGRIDNNDAVGNRIDELHQRVIDVEQRQPAVDAYDISDITPKLAALSGRIEQVAELAAAPAQPDDDLAARLDELSRSAESVEVLNSQLVLLNARVAAQAEMTEQLKALSDRIGLLQQRSIDTDEVFSRIDELATNPPYVADLSERVVELSSRLSASEEQQRLVTEQAARLELQLASDDAERRAEAIREELRAEIEAMRTQIAAQLDTPDPNVDAFGAQIAQLAERVAANERDNRTARDELTGKLAAQAASTVAISSLHDRLAASEADARSAIELAHAVDQRIAEQLTELTASIPSVAGVDQQIAELRGRLDAQSGLPDQLATLNARVGVLGEQGAEIDRLRSQIDEIAAAIPTTDVIEQRVDQLTDRLGSTEAAAADARAHAAAIDQRLATATTELANQIGEIGREIDTLATREPEPVVAAIDEAATSALRAGQVKLATEQARFEISFRDDLATLAEQVRQLRGRG